MKRLIAISQKAPDKEQQKHNRINFYRFFKEHDRRRGTDFVKVFPELKSFWKNCQRLNERYEKEKKKGE